MSTPVHERIAVVTGGTRGIGLAIARRLLADGYLVTVTGTKPYPPRHSVDGCKYYAVDFYDKSQRAQLASDLASWNVDILVNNAGINKIGPFAELNLEDFERIQAVNVHAPFEFCQAVIPSMKQKGWGRIVNICSIFGRVSKEFRAPYSASKFALDGMTAALAAEVAADGVLANCVSPGFIDTELTQTVLGPSGIAELVSRVPMRRLGRPEEVAALVSWLVGPENTFISGQNIVIDGGFTRV